MAQEKQGGETGPGIEPANGREALTIERVARDVYDAWARSGDAAYFERPWTGPFTTIGHPCANDSAFRIACRLIGAWNPHDGGGYGGVAREHFSHRFVIIGGDGLVPCPCGGDTSPKMPGYPCRRCGDRGRALPDHDLHDLPFANHNIMQPSRFESTEDSAAFVAQGGTDRKIHVRGSEFDGPVRCEKYPRRWVSTIYSASDWWGPGARGWPDVCRECYRVEHKLAEALP